MSSAGPMPRYGRAAGGDVVAVALIAAAWPALWLLSMSPDSADRPPARKAPETRYVFCRVPAAGNAPFSPTLVVLPPRPASAAMKDENLENGAVQLSRSETVPLLDSVEGTVARTPAADEAAPPARSAYSPFIDEPPALAPVGPPEPGFVSIDMAATLRTRALDVGSVETGRLPQPEQTWLVRAWIEVNADGEVDQALVERAVAPAEVAMAVVTALRRCRASPSDASSSGWVQVSGTGARAAGAQDRSGGGTETRQREGDGKP